MYIYTYICIFICVYKDDETDWHTICIYIYTRTYEQLCDYTYIYIYIQLGSMYLSHRNFDVLDYLIWSQLEDREADRAAQRDHVEFLHSSWRSLAHHQHAGRRRKRSLLGKIFGPAPLGRRRTVVWLVINVFWTYMCVYIYI